MPFGYHTAILSAEEKPKYFLAHPLDLAIGGVKMLHRMPLKKGDGFKLFFRPMDLTQTTPAWFLTRYVTWLLSKRN